MRGVWASMESVTRSKVAATPQDRGLGQSGRFAGNGIRPLGLSDNYQYVVRFLLHFSQLQFNLSIFFCEENDTVF